MRAFLQTYSLSIFTIIIIGVMVLVANPLGLTVEGYTKEEIVKLLNKTGDGFLPTKQLKGEAVAIFSDDDDSLTFYRVETIPEVGSVYEGKTVTAVYTGIETDDYYYYLDPETGVEDIFWPGWVDVEGGKVASYIKKVEFKGEIRPISMSGWFYGCSSLTEYPDIPDSVINMEGAFARTGLKKAPKIPDSVVDMDRTFKNCYSLTEAPVIPSSVTSMEWTFENCTSLVNAPIIPENVVNLERTFKKCTSLTGDVVINANPTEYSQCFYNTRKAITIAGDCSDTTKANLANTANYSNITY